MMISPVSFYEYLKGKNAKEIQKEIRSLKIEITKNKNKLENQWTSVIIAGVRTTQQYVFSGCICLKEITIPGSFTAINYGTF